VPRSKPIDTAWRLILSNQTSDRTTLEQLFSFCPDSNYAITRQFSTIHKAVLKLEGLDTRLLPDLIAKVTEVNLDATDVWGMTAMAWAAQSNDADAIYTLLRLGADPDKADIRDVTPLKRTTDLQCMELLLEAGANINAPDDLKQTPIFAATRSPSCVRKLLQHGASINPIERSQGLTPAHFCTNDNRAESLRVLLRHGADFRVRALDGGNLLHTAAKVSNAHTFNVLIEAAEAGLVWDDHEVNEEGETFRILAEKRIEEDTEVRAALIRLMKAVEANEEVSETILEGTWSNEEVGETDAGLMS
jgi:ankyrin repeat protein